MNNIRTLYARMVPHALNWSSSLKRGKQLAPLLLRAVVLVVGDLSVSRVKITWGFARRCVSLHRYLGSKGLALYLKTSFVLLQQSLGGMTGTAPLKIGMNVARTRKGFPRIIDRRDRQRILSGDVTIIRLWLTMLGLYRVIDFRGKLKLSTITSPGPDLFGNGFMKLWARWLPIFLLKLSKETKLPWKMRLDRELTPNSIPLIRKKSPNSGGLSSVAAIPLDIVNWALFAPLELMKAFSLYLQEVDGLELVWGLRPFIKRIQEWRETVVSRYTQCLRLNPFYANPFARDPQRAHHGPWEPESTVRIEKVSINPLEGVWGPVTAFGRLGFKEEPGKIRVFAMVDALTQALLYPLHKWIFKRLRAIGTDGTFNQHAPLEKLVKRMNDPSKSFVASYDLSAATDRLPLILQQKILEATGSGTYGRAWATLLIGRSYKLPKEARSWNLGFDEVHYAVGQPMGAYSSWAMLALTHHALVQLAYFQVNPKDTEGWFQDYAVLGDDVCIANKAVANEYLRIMNLIGVEIGLAKSLVSAQGTFEFAKRTYFRGQDVSGISLDEVSVSLKNLTALMELIRKNMKFERIRVSTVARFVGFGYRNLGRLQVIWALGNRLGRLSACLHQPGGIWSVPFEAWVSAVGPGGASKEDLFQWPMAVGIWYELVNRAVNAIVAVEKLLPLLGLYSYSYGEDRPMTEDEKKGRTRSKPLKLPNGLIAVQGYLGNRLGKEGKLDAFISISAFNDFFLEWVARPFHDQLRARVKKVDEVIRQYDPYTLPTWKALGDLWSDCFQYKSEALSFPRWVQMLSRQNDDISLREGGRVLLLWLKLRKLSKSNAPRELNLATQTRTWPKAARRWDKGLGQDRLNLANSRIFEAARSAGRKE